MRQLASIQSIAALTPIEGADMIECATILGWHLVVKKGEFQVGDSVVYFEVDAFLPVKPEFEFLRKSCYRSPIQLEGQDHPRDGFRIKTVRLRGQVSQGLCLPLSILPEGAITDIGTDVSEILDVIKWDLPVPAHLAGTRKGNFPAFLPKTDETRVQSLEGFYKLQGEKLYITEKMDGSSFTAFATASKDTWGICSRNLLLDELDESLTGAVLVRELDLLNKLSELAARDGVAGYAVQGELCGPGIQKNRYGFAKHRLLAFNVLVFDPTMQGQARLLGWTQLTSLCSQLGLETVPFLGIVTLNHSKDDLVEMSRGKSTHNPKVHREGLVFRSQDGGQSRISFKAINPDFLLKYEE